MEQITLKIEGMTCGGCVNSLTHVLQAIAGVSQVEVTLEPGEANLVFDAMQTNSQALHQAIQNAGFDVIN